MEAIELLLAEPEVARWWGGTGTAELIREDLGIGLTVRVGGVVAGWLLVTEDPGPMYRSVSLDIALTSALHGQGYGREALTLVIRHAIAHGHHRFTIDPAARNERAIRCYTAVGFRPVGILREYERAVDGRWHDGLLMDLLAREVPR